MSELRSSNWPARECRTIINIAAILGCTILIALWGAGIPMDAQESASSGIVGQVTDSTQAGVPGATVTVTNAGTSAQRVATTDAQGAFSIPNLPPATYQIRVEKPGFQTALLNS